MAQRMKALSRSPQPGFRLGSAGHIPVRKQSLRHVDVGGARLQHRTHQPAACAYGIPGVTVDGNDLLAVYDAISTAARRAREGAGPSLVESVTYRWRGHSRSDRQLYRTRDEVKEWQAKDPIPRFANRLVAAGFVQEAELEGLRKEGHQRIEEAVAFAEASPEPDLATIMEGVYAH
jgi:acetoin:2,6-dichlorophenolindophenol oxidoreductase subunit alpha